MERCLIIFEGRVQGVGFRYTVYHIANDYNLTGLVRNMDNGNVEVQVQGDKENIDSFLQDVLSDSLKERSFIHIIDYTFKKMPLVEGEKKFIVAY